MEAAIVPAMSVHVAILRRPYLDLVLAGEKTVECRLTKQARAPFEAIEPGERIHFKESCGGYRATAVAARVRCERDLTPARIEAIRRDHGHLIRGEDEFWARKRESRYATLIWITDVQATAEGPPIPRQRGRAWLVLPEGPS